MEHIYEVSSPKFGLGGKLLGSFLRCTHIIFRSISGLEDSRSFLRCTHILFRSISGLEDSHSFVCCRRILFRSISGLANKLGHNWWHKYIICRSMLGWVGKQVCMSCICYQTHSPAGIEEYICLMSDPIEYQEHIVGCIYPNRHQSRILVGIVWDSIGHHYFLYIL